MFIFHIGLPKTGTTSLQSFLKTEQSIIYLGKFTNSKLKKNDKIAEIIRSFLYNKKELYFHKTLKKYKFNFDKSKNYFYSEEDILTFYSKIPLDEKLKRLKYFLSFYEIRNYKILITERKPLDLMMSLITEDLIHFRYKKNINFNSLLNDPRIFEYINFKKKVSKYFPKKNLLFLNYEKFIQKKKCDELKKLLNIKKINLPYKNKSKKIKFKNFHLFFSKVQIYNNFKVLYYSKSLSKFFNNLIFTLRHLVIILTKQEFKKLEKIYEKKIRS